MAVDKDKVLRDVQQLVRKSSWDKALDEMKRLHAEYRHDPMVTLRMGDIYLKAGNRENAAKCYAETAEIFTRSGHTAKAIATYKMIQRVDPGNKIAGNRLDELAAERERLAGPVRSGAGPTAGKPAEPVDTIELSGSPAAEPVFVQGPHEYAADRPPLPIQTEQPELDEGLVGGSGLDRAEDAPETEPARLAPAEVPAIPLFSVIPEPELRALVGRMKKKTFGKGDTIVSEGEQGNSLYIIKKGGALVLTHVKGMNVLLAELGERDFFGEVSFLTGRPRTADIIASEPTEVLELTGGDLADIVEKYHDVEDVLRMFHETRIGDTLSSIKAVPDELLQ